MLSVALIVAFFLMVLSPCLVALRCGPRLGNVDETEAPVLPEAALERAVVDPMARPGNRAEEALRSPAATMAPSPSLHEAMLQADRDARNARAAAAEADALACQAAAYAAAIRSQVAAVRAEEARREALTATADVETARMAYRSAADAEKPATGRREAA